MNDKPEHIEPLDSGRFSLFNNTNGPGPREIAEKLNELIAAYNKNVNKDVDIGA